MLDGERRTIPSNKNKPLAGLMPCMSNYGRFHCSLKDVVYVLTIRRAAQDAVQVDEIDGPPNAPLQ